MADAQQRAIYRKFFFLREWAGDSSPSPIPMTEQALKEIIQEVTAVLAVAQDDLVFFRKEAQPGMYRADDTISAIKDLLAPPQTSVQDLEDTIDGLRSDLDSAVTVAYNYGAGEWVRLNFPALYKTLSEKGPQ